MSDASSTEAIAACAINTEPGSKGMMCSCGHHVTSAESEEGSMSEPTTRIAISTEEEFYPMLGITQGYGATFDVPTALFDALRDAQRAEAAAELAIMRHVAEAYPDAQHVHEWLAEQERP
jgi:hypothetical protein